MFRKLLLILTIITSNYTALAADAKIIRIASGEPTAGAYYPTALQLCHFIQKEFPDEISCQIIVTEGSIENVRQLRNKQVDFAIVQSDVALNSYNGKGLFEGQDALKNLRAISNLFQEDFAILIHEDAAIENFKDLKNKKLGIANNKSGAMQQYQKLVTYHKFSQDELPTLVDIPNELLGTELCDKKIDGVILSEATPNNIIHEITKTCPISIVAYDNEILNSFVKENSEYFYNNIPAKTYKGILENVPTLSTKAFLVTLAETDNDIVENMHKTIMRNISEIKLTHPSLRNLSIENLHDQQIIPFHQKVKIPESDKEQ